MTDKQELYAIAVLFVLALIWLADEIWIQYEQRRDRLKDEREAKAFKAVIHASRNGAPQKEVSRLKREWKKELDR